MAPSRRFPALATAFVLALGLLGAAPAQAVGEGHIQGSVSGPNGPLANEPVIALSAYAEDGQVFFNDNDDDGDPDKVVGATNGSGNFDLAVAPGDYILRIGTNPEGTAGAGVAKYYPNTLVRAESELISVAMGQTVTGKNAELELAGQISGKVTNDAGEGLSDVDVRAYGPEQISGGHIGKAETAEDGTYTIRGLPAGPYKLGFEDDSGDYADEFYTDKATLETATSIPVAAGQTVSGKDAVLTSTNVHVSGRVTNNAGTGLGGIAATLEFWASGEGYWEELDETTTEADGTYALTESGGANRMRVEFSDPNGVYARSVTPEFDAVDGQTVTDQDAVLSAAARISGAVTNTAGAAMPYVSISVFDADGEWAGWAETAEDGTYTVGGLAAGSYRLLFADWYSGEEWFDDKTSLETADPITVAEGDTASGTDVELGLGTAITGKVTKADGTGIDSAAVYVYDANGNYAGFSQAAADGSYLVTGLQAGQYRVYFEDWYNDYVAEWFSDKGSFEDADPIAVADGQTVSGTNAVLADVPDAPGQISGRVTSASGGGLDDVAVGVYDELGQRVDGVATRTDGNYTIRNLPAGDYRLQIGGYGDHIDEWFNDKATLETADPITVGEGQIVTGKDVVLAVKNGAISGTVTNAAGTGVEYAYIEAYDADGDWAGWAQTGPAGTYQITGLASGTYRLRVDNWSDSSLISFEYYNNKSTLETADPIAVTVGQTASGKNFVLETAGRITGTVRNAAGTGLSGTDIEVFDSAGDLVQWAYTDDDGSYVVDGLTTGTYRLYFSGPSGYLNEYFNDKSTLATADPVAVTVGQTASGKDVELLRGGRITGRVKNADGVGIGDAAIDVYDAQGDQVKHVHVRSDGTYTVRGLATGDYRLYAFDESDEETYLPEWFNEKATLDTANPISVTVGQTVSRTNIVLALDNASVTTPDDVETETGSVTRNPETGQTTVSMPSGDRSPVTIDFPASCEGGAAPTSVTLLLEEQEFAATAVAPGQYRATIPADQLEDGTLRVQTTCGATAGTSKIGKIVLYDPSGFVTDAATGDPVVGAEVRLFKVPTWAPKTTPGAPGDSECETNESKAAGAPWSQPAPTSLGQLVNANSEEISPNVNPFLTNDAGRYGWDVAQGCWYVTVKAAGYANLTSPVVGVPSEVTDLDLALNKEAIANTTPPAITGTPTVGATLTASDGTWSTAPTSFDYVWKAGGVTVGTDANTYTPIAADVGKTITVTVTAKRAGFNDGTATSTATAAVAKPDFTTAPVPAISGTVKVGATLTAQEGAWAPGQDSFAYVWKANGVAVVGATARTLTLTANELGKAITVEVTAKKSGFNDSTQVSSPTAAVAAGTLTAPVPKVTGIAKVGKILSGTPGTWTPAPVTLRYQWLANGVAISRATARTYKVAPGVLGKRLSLRVTGTRTGYTTVAKVSAKTGAVVKGTLVAPRPKVRGTAKVGRMLTAAPGTWRPAPVRLRYQWLANGAPISRATSRTYTIRAAQAGKRLSVRVTGTKTGYNRALRTSAKTAVVAR